MIHKIIKGSYFKGALRYVLDPAKGILIGGSFGSNQTPAQIASEMRDIAGDRLKRPVFHAVLSLRPRESLTNGEWSIAARRYMEALGFTDSPYVLVRHTNRPHDHVHIIASRVGFDGKVVSDKNDRIKGLQAVQEISKDYGLSTGRGPSGQSVVADELRTLINRATEGNPTLDSFFRRLEASGIRLTTRVSSKAERLQGVTYHFDGMSFKASDLGRDYTWRGLQKSHRVHFSQATDREAVLSRAYRGPALQDQTAWSNDALRDLSARLRCLRSDATAAGFASRQLLSTGARALGAAAHVSNFLEGRVRPGRLLARTLLPKEQVSLALAFLGAVRSPGSAAIALLQLADGIVRTTRPKPSPPNPAHLFLRQLIHSAAGDRPTFAVFRERLAEAGVHLGDEAYILPDRVIPGRAIGMNGKQLQKLGVTDAAKEFERGRLHRSTDFGDRDGGSVHRDTSPGHGSTQPRHPSARGTRAASLATEEGSGRPGRAAGAALDRAPLGREPSTQQHQASAAPNLGDDPRDRPHDHPSSPRRPDFVTADLVPQREYGRSAPDWTAHLGAPSSPSEGTAAAHLESSRRAGLFSRDFAAQLQALGNEEGVEIRVRPREGGPTNFRAPTPDVIEKLLPLLSQHAQHGASLEIRALDPHMQHLSGVSQPALERASRRGAEPAIVLQRGDGLYDVWVRHHPTATLETLPSLARTLRAEYQLPVLDASQPFGAVAGSESVRLIEASGRSYTRAQALADYFEASRRILEQRLTERLQSVGVTSLADYRKVNPGPNADREWSRFALRQGLAPQDVAQELIRSSSRSQAGPRARALYVSRVLAASLPPDKNRDPHRQLLEVAARVLGVSVDALSIVRNLLIRSVRLTLGRP